VVISPHNEDGTNTGRNECNRERTEGNLREMKAEIRTSREEMRTDQEKMTVSLEAKIDVNSEKFEAHRGTLVSRMGIDQAIRWAASYLFFDDGEGVHVPLKRL
jgi:hypothetical protein